MSLQVEKLEHNMAKLTIEVEAEEFAKAMKEAYNKQKGKISVQGFRKGKVPMAYLEKVYGPEMFYEDAANIILPKAYEDAAKESELEITSAPKIDVTQMEKGKSFIFTAEVAVKPAVTLGEYKGLEVPKTEIEVTVEDRPVMDKDIVNIDYAGSIDGVAFDGGTAEGQPLEIGSHSFIDNFEEQLIGHNIGEEVDVHVTFPEEYHAEDLAGKPALFKVKINGIKAKELPVIDDDFAQDVSEFDTLDEFKADIRKKLTEKKEAAAKTDKENAVVDKAIENAEMDIPQPMIDSQADQMADEFAQRIQYQGLTLDQYFQFTGMTREKMLEDLQPQAKKAIQTRLVLEAIVEAEKIEASDEDLDEELSKMASMYQMELDQVKSILGDAQKDAMRKDIAVQKAVTFLCDEAKEV